MRTFLAAALTFSSAFAIAAQELRFLYPAPPAGSVTVTRDVNYGTAGETKLMMDVHKPSAAGATRVPAIVFFNRASGPQRSNAFYNGWAQTAASKGIVGIVPDLRDGSAPADFKILIDHLVQRAADYGIDREAIAVYAGSGNVYTALPIVEDPRMTAVKAAVMYYGTSPVKEFRLDLPLLYVRAGLDRPGVNRGITELASSAVSQNAPITLVNHPVGHHAFELFDDDEATRDMVERTIEFVKRATASSYQASLRRGLQEATAAGHVLTGNYRQAAAVYAEMVAARPDDARLRLSYGEALSGDGQHAAACAEFEKLKGKGLGPRDLGMPAARACMQKGDPDAAIAWIRSIPERFRPADFRKDPVFAPIKDRPDFIALFESR